MAVVSTNPLYISPLSLINSSLYGQYIAVHFDMYVAIPRKLRNDVILVDGGILNIAAVLFGSGL